MVPPASVMSGVELHCHSYYSFLDGASSPEALVEAAAHKGIGALALTDRDGLYGASTFFRCCREHGIKALIGAQLTMEGEDQLLVLCKSMEGYRRLSHLITQAYVGREKGEPLTLWSRLSDLGTEVFYLIGGKGSRLWGMVHEGADPSDYLQKVLRFLPEDHVFLELNHHQEEGDTVVCQRMLQLGIPCVASNAARYAEKENGHLYEVLRCIGAHCTLDEAHALRSGNRERYLKSADEWHPLLKTVREQTEALAGQCHIEIDFSAYRFPEYPVPTNETPVAFLKRLCEEGMRQRYPAEKHTQVRVKLEHELTLIESLDLVGYFLVVWDIVAFARRQGIPCQGRGSAANSLVAYLLWITPIDPIAHSLYLGRFIHEGMTAIPDIDLDFASTRHPEYPDREDVIQYIYEKYSPEHVAMVCTFVTFQRRSAIREVGKVFGIPDTLLDRWAKLSGRRVAKNLETMDEDEAKIPEHTLSLFWRFVEEVQDIPRHPGIHVGGMLIAARPISDLVPIEPARMKGRFVCQWDKDMVDDAGLIKVDILGLGMLAVLRETERLLDSSIDLEALSFDDPKVYEQLGKADTVGVFQVESRAQMQSLPRTRPRNFQELGIQVAIIRPGPLQGNMVTPYILRRQGKEPVSYPHPSVEPILKETLGVILFQEQVLQVATSVAGFSSQQAADLRRVMSRKRSKAAMAAIKVEFLAGAKEKGIDPAVAESIFATLEGFALYGFCKSHALSFARIAYVSAWLRYYYPAAFAAALLNNQPMGFYTNKTILEDAKRHGVHVLPVDVNFSTERCHIEQGALRLGFQLVRSLSFQEAQVLVQERNASGPFFSIRQLIQRSSLPKKVLEALVEAGACDSWGIERRELLWQLWLYIGLDRSGPDLFAGQQERDPTLPPSSDWDRLYGEYRAIGLSPERHPMELLRPQLQGMQLQRSDTLAQVPNDSPSTVGGLVTCHQRPPTAKGFAFLTLEDEFGMLNVIVPPKIYEQYKVVIKSHPFLLINGTCQQEDGVTNLIAKQVMAVK